MTNKAPDKEHMRMLEALATVSSLAFMAVIDFQIYRACQHTAKHAVGKGTALP